MGLPPVYPKGKGYGMILVCKLWLKLDNDPVAAEGVTSGAAISRLMKGI
jgi:hypothetical protein